MKKILSFITAATVILSLSGCGNKLPEEVSIATNTGTSMYNQIMETEDGYYYNSTLFGDLSLRYYDKATGSSLYLCAKPECTHDGNSFCTATGGGFHTSYTAMYGDNIYIAISDIKDGSTSYKLLCASIDGTELTEICTFLEFNTAAENGVIIYEDNKSMVIHKGKAFIPYLISTSDTEMAGRTGAAIVDLNSGKYELLSEYDMSQTTGVSNITANGDYFYYTTYFYKERQTRLHRCNIITGEEETLSLGESLIENFGIEQSIAAETYTVIDGKIWYAYQPQDILTNDIYIYDPENNTTEKAEQFVEKLGDIQEIYDTNGEVFSINFNAYVNCELKYDGEYLYAAENGFYGGEYNDFPMRLHIFNLEGENLGNFTYERTGACQVNIVNKTVYIQTVEGVEYCTVDDIINENIEWQKLYSFEQNTGE